MTHWPLSNVRRVLFDTSAYFAMADEDDEHHTSTHIIIAQLIAGRFRPFTTNFVVAETHALLLNRLNHHAATQFLREVDQGSTTIIRVSRRDEQRARTIIYQYGDKDFAFTDALSFAVMERLHKSVAFSFDQHFAQYGLTVAFPEHP